MAQTRIETMIWAIETLNPSTVWPRTWRLMMTTASLNRGSLHFGSTTGIMEAERIDARSVAPPTRSPDRSPPS